MKNKYKLQTDWSLDAFMKALDDKSIEYRLDLECDRKVTFEFTFRRRQQDIDAIAEIIKDLYLL